MVRTALEGLTRLKGADLAGQPAPSIAGLGREMKRLWAEHDEIDTKKIEALKEQRQEDAARLGREFEASEHRINANEEAICQGRAETLEDAMVQVMVAYALAKYCDDTIRLSGADESEEMRKIALLTYSVVGFLEEASGTDRDEFGAESGMSRKYDPRAQQPA